MSCQGQGQPEAAAERRVHLQRAEGEPWVAGYGCKPSAGMRPGLRAEESLLGGGQRRKQGVLAVGCEKCERSSMLPAMGPISKVLSRADGEVQRRVEEKWAKAGKQPSRSRGGAGRLLRLLGMWRQKRPRQGRARRRSGPQGPGRVGR